MSISPQHLSRRTLLRATAVAAAAASLRVPSMASAQSAAPSSGPLPLATAAIRPTTLIGLL